MGFNLEITIQSYVDKKCWKINLFKKKLIIDKILLLFLKTLESSLARAGTFLGVEREVNRFKIKKE